METLELEKSIKVAVVYNAFDPTDVQKDELVYDEGKSLAHYLDGLPSECDWAVGLNGVPVKWEETAVTIPAANDVISLVVIPRGGTAKDVLRIVALVALVVAASYFLGPGGALGLTGWVAGAAVATAVTVGGFLINMLLPPKMPKMEGLDDGQNYGYDGAKNTAKEGMAIPVVYGEYRVAGNYIDLFTENQGNQQYLYARCVLSDGEIDSVTDIEVNEQPIATYKSMLFGTTIGTKTESINYNFGRSIAQISKGVKLSTSATTHLTSTAVDALQANIYFPRGIVEYDDKGKKKRRSVTIQVNYRLQGSGGWSTVSQTYSGNDAKTQRYTKEIAVTRGIYEMEVRRTTAESTDDQILDEVWLGDVGEIQASNVAVRTVATGWYKVLMTDQLSQVPNVTWKVKGVKVNHYNTAGNVTSKAWSANPAWIVLDMLISEERGPFHTSGIGIDYPAFVEWANYCSTNGFLFNGVFDTTKSLWDALTDVFKVGRATPTRIGTKLSVAIDRATTPVMLFGAGNIEKDTFNISYLALSDRANEFEVSYFDKNDRNKQKSIRIIDPDAEARGDVPRPVSYSLIGIDNFEQAQKEVWYQLYMNRLAKRVITFNAPIESIGLTIGDVALIQHDMVDWGISGRIKSATTTQITLDKDVSLADGNTLLVTHDSLNGDTDVIEERTVTAVDEATNTVTVSPAFSAAPKALSNYMFGESTIVKKPFRLRAISGDDLYSRNLTFVEYHEAIYGPPEQVIPQPTVKLDNVVAQIANLGFITAQEYGPTAEEAIVTIGWTSGHIRNYGGADVYVSRINKDEVDQTPNYVFERTILNTNEIQISAQYDVNVDVKVVAFNVKGFRANYNDAPVLSATIDSTIVVKTPTVASDGTAVDHTVDSATGVAKISFEWTWPGLVAEVDGFHVTVLSSTTTDFTNAAKEIFITGPSQTAIVLGGVDANKYYKISVKAYRRVHDMLDVTGFIFSSEVFPTGTGENPYRPLSHTPYSGDILGSIVEPNPHLDVLGKVNTDPNATRNVFRGVWDTGVIYSVGDMFSYNGSTYIVTEAHTSTGSSPDMTKVSVMAEGNSAVTVFLTNEAHTVPTQTDGTGGDFSQAVGSIKVFIDATDVTSTAVFGTPTATNCTGEVNNTTNQFFTGVKGAYRVTAMTADTASLSIPITIDGITITRVFTLAKSKGGANAKTLIIISDRQTVAYDKQDVVLANQTTTFTAQKQNTTATVSWKISTVDAPNTFLTPVTNYLSASTGNSVTMSTAQFESARGTTQGVIVTGELTDSTVISDKISIYKIKAGSDGVNAKTVVVVSDKQAFTYNGNAVLTPNPQVITFSMQRQNTTGSPSWSAEAFNSAGTSLGSVQLQSSSGSGGSTATTQVTVYLHSEDLPANTARIIVTGTCDSISDYVSIIRLQDGIDALVGYLTNESHGVPSNSDGSFPAGAFTGASGSFKVFFGLTDVTSGCTFAVSGSTDGTYSANINSSGVYSISSFNSALDTYYIDFTATYTALSKTITKRFSLSKSKTGATGATGSAAKGFYITSDRQSIKYSTNDIITPASQSIVLNAYKQNTTQPVTWFCNRLDGTGVDLFNQISGMVDDGPGSGVVGDSGTMTASTFDNLRGGTEGILLTANCDGLTDRIAILKVKDGAIGYAAYLTNETHTLPASGAGVVSTYSGASGSFKVLLGGVDITSNFTLSTVANPQALTVVYSNQDYSVTGGLDSNEEIATVTIRASGSGTYAGLTFDKLFTLTKSKSGADGSNAKLLFLYSDSQTVPVSSTGVPLTGSSVINFTASKQNTNAAVTFSITKIDGSAVDGGVTLSGSGDTRSITHTNFNTARGSTDGVIVTATLTDGTTLTDKISIIKVASGSAGTSAKLITLTASTVTVAADSSGTAKTPTAKIIYNATLQGLAGNPTWRVVSPTGTQLYSGGPLNGGAWTSTGPLHMEQTHAGFASDMAQNNISGWTIEVSIVDNGTTYKATESVSLVKDGSAGSGSGGSSGDINVYTSAVVNQTVTEELSFPVTAGNFVIEAEWSGENSTAGGATHTVHLVKHDNTTVLLGSGPSGSNGSSVAGGIINQTIATGLASGVWKTWKIRVSVTANGSGQQVPMPDEMAYTSCHGIYHP